MSDKPYQLMLFVAQGQPNSVRAQKNLRQICEEVIPGKYHLKVIDVVKEPELAVENGIYLTPMLVVSDPPPPASITGDMAERKTVLAALKIGGGQ
ncbi:MAG TPA: circadian clock protein KaiB [Desulfobacteraceae bacterium]|nr:circadian clock protein KaiB [Desulfobacteraceae bacterium]|tara:strand:- start:557 stop:841 length:285 start_codon:yes stop_codon:yes gene_type:complete